MTTVKAIHPEDKKLYAESPYTRKLTRLLEDLSTTRMMAPEDHKDALAKIICELKLLTGGEACND